MDIKKISPFIVLILMLSISIPMAYSFEGDMVQKIMITVMYVMVFLSVSGLIGVWRDLKIYKINEVKLICFIYPVSIIIVELYPLFLYSISVQEIPSIFYIRVGMEFSFSILISGILWSYYTQPQN
ncbi:MULTISPECIES: hypothetical protein [Vibrio]|uniref:hypothetical protein n=1 Tax=Vibrio TaxID=662 RepID=UPI001373680F|nr:MULTISPECIES: hypothetical protein [Vibrio]MBF4258611.1 hypothetical protein [Vibrio anguillarum]MBF4300221.1 hypothetical protein [Vibrio anguillarum]MBF4399163.1 hypothetical protein [Vibrio anguillarum]MBF4440971.1 hypothetical protein [Vibrio anguillarum]NAW98999.1 hypothetical protein [Vibrio sp. V23_P3S9T160]